MADRGYELLPQGSDQPGQADSMAAHEPAWLRRDKRRRWGFVGGATILLVLVLVFAIARGFRAGSDLGELGIPERVGTNGLLSQPQYPWLNPSNSLNFNHSTALARGVPLSLFLFARKLKHTGITREPSQRYVLRYKLCPSWIQ